MFDRLINYQMDGMAARKVFDEHFLEIAVDSDNRWLYANWKGYQTDHSIKTGVNRLIDLVSEQGITQVLNDNTNTVGIWVGVATWLVFDALPRARQAGMTAFAYVLSPSRFSQVSAETALALLGQAAPDIEAFDDVQSAAQWLRTK